VRVRRLAVPNLGFWGGCLLAALTACSVQSGEGSHDSGAGGSIAIMGSGGTHGDAPTIVIDGGSTVRPGTLQLVVPAYYAPGPEWQKIIAAAPTVGMIIFNPANGPGTTTDPAYTAAIAQAQAAGIRVLGYVATSYGQRPVADIMADVNKYYDLYAPSGVYFAEGPMEADCTNLEAEYRQLTSLALSRDSKAYLAIGTRFCPSFIEFSDLMVEFAEDWTTYQSYTVPAWMPANSPQRFCQFINSVPPEEASHALSMAVSNGAGWVFATDGVQPNPWSALPSYWDQELAAMRALQ
jgi:hypothetical protein